MNLQSVMTSSKRSGRAKCSFRVGACFLATCVAALSATESLAAIILSNPITNTNPSASNPFNAGQTVHPNVTSTGIGRGAGINANAGGDRYNATAWNLAAFDASDYFTFSITPNSGFEIDFTNFVYVGQRSSTGPSSFSFRSSVDGFASSIGSATATGTTISLAAAAYQNISSPIEFRFYGWGGTSASGTFSINDFTFNGEVNSLASPDIDTAQPTVSFLPSVVGAVLSEVVTLNEVGGAAANYTSTITGDAIVQSGASGSIGANGSGAINVGLNTSSAASKAGTVVVNDGNPDVDQIAVSGSVFDPSTALFASNGANNLTIDFVAQPIGSGVLSLGEAIYNALQTLDYTAELDFDSINGIGDTDVLSTDLVAGAFTNLNAGIGNGEGFQVLFDTNNAYGSYSATYTLGLSDSDNYLGAGAAGSQVLTLTVTGSLVPEPSSFAVLGLGIAAMGCLRLRLQKDRG
ncbi:hypothetical protein [Aeoliella sp. SH292]|uniref:hypothetical protein n=1 Tax=Aeoliella sp. SH292 TaxID=3454464 RepID=UPI003F96A962